MTPLSFLATIKSDISPERLRLLLTGATVGNQSLDPRDVARTALQLASEATGLNMGMVLVLTRGKRVLLAKQGFPPDWIETFLSAAISFEGSIIEQALDSRLPKVYSKIDYSSNDAVSQHLQLINLQSVACLPLQVSGNMPGILLMGDALEQTFSPEDVDFLRIIAGQINTGLHNAWLFSQSQRQLEEARSVAEAARTVVSSLDSNQILTRIMEEVTTRLDTEAAALLMVDHARQELEFAAVAGPKSGNLRGVRLPMGQGIVGWVAEHNQPLLVPDVSKDPRFFKGLDKKTETTSQAILCVPLRVKDELIGVVEVINKKQGPFTATDQHLLESLATFAAVAIQNARYYEESNRQMDQATLYARDLTTTFRQERRQREALDKLRFSFLNVVGHELKTPLTVILQGLEALKSQKFGLLNTEQTEITHMLDEQSAYLHRMIDGLIAFATFSARQGVMKFKETSFDSVLDEVLLLARFKATPRQITIHENRPAPLPTFSLDKEQLSEALLQLIDNAIKYSPAGGIITFNVEFANEELNVSISDQGPGIPADQVDRIWDSFVQMNTTLERGLEGLGLGLAIARYIVEAHNGRISVDSVVGKGSTFIVRLPCKT